MYYKKAFTLIELLLVIGIIAILAGIVILAVNPIAQLRKAEDSRRTAHARELQSALAQYVIDTGSMPAGISSTEMPVCAYGVTDPSCVNLDVLVDQDYVVSLERDVAETNTDFTGFSIAQSAGGFMTVAAEHMGVSGGATGGGGGAGGSSSSSAPLFPFSLVQESPAATFANIAGYIGMDASSNMILVNSFAGSVDFTRGVGASTPTAGGTDIFLAKYSRLGVLVSVQTIGSTAMKQLVMCRTMHLETWWY